MRRKGGRNGRGKGRKEGGAVREEKEQKIAEKGKEEGGMVVEEKKRGMARKE